MHGCKNVPTGKFSSQYEKTRRKLSLERVNHHCLNNMRHLTWKNASEWVITRQNASERVRRRQNASELVKMCQNASECVRVHLRQLSATHHKNQIMKCYWEWLPSLISTLWNIGILHYKQAKLRKDMQHSVLKGQIISKRFFPGRGFFQKTNENTSHSSKNEFICSFFGKILGLTICFRN